MKCRFSLHSSIWITSSIPQKLHTKIIIYILDFSCCFCVFRRRLSHSKLVQLYGVRTQCSPMCLVFEFMENGCLSDYLRARKGHLSKETMLGMCLDVSEGMAYLESSNFIHRDLVT